MGRMEGCRGAPQVLSRSRTTPRQHMSGVAQSPGVGPKAVGWGTAKHRPKSVPWGPPSQCPCEHHLGDEALRPHSLCGVMG